MKPVKVVKGTPRIETSTADALQNLLDTTYTLYLATHNFHFNVEGKDFYSLHILLENQYQNLFLAIDVIGERIRALGQYVTIPNHVNVEKLAKLCVATLSKNSDTQTKEMIEELIKLNEEAIASCVYAKKIAQNAQDDETHDLIVGRIASHQKTNWMLNSLIK